MTKRPIMRSSLMPRSQFDRRLRVYFYTSNTEKLLQARHIFERAGQTVSHFRARREPYEEDYRLSKHELLEEAISQVRSEFLVRSIFFVEDTSIRIEALSHDDDYPGLRAKEWFASTDFAELDEQLRLAGGNRRAIVKSDICLHIPNLPELFFFAGETHGTVAEEPPDFRHNERYPWLTPQTFNGWIIPDGAISPLGSLSIEDSLDFDFRSKALRELLDFLQPINAAVNLPPNFYYRQRDETRGEPQPYLPHIFETAEDRVPPIICIIGHKCAGKTTASEYVAANFGAAFYEASEQLRLIAQDVGRTVQSGEDARQFLDEFGSDVVARQISDQIQERAGPIVVSGFRTIEEVNCLHSAHRNVHVLLLQADQRIRFERHVSRGRDSHVRTPQDFRMLDLEQISFGLLEVGEEVADMVVTNDGELGSFYRRVDAVVGRIMFQNSLEQRSEQSELHRSLRALSNFDRYASCEEIAEETAKLGVPVRRYNTNRALKAASHFADRSSSSHDVLRYRLNSSGESLLRYLDRKAPR